MSNKYALATAVFLFFAYLASKGELQAFFDLVKPKGKTVVRSGLRQSQTNTLSIPAGSSIKNESVLDQLKNYGAGAVDMIKGIFK